MATDYRRMRVKRFAPLEERETPEAKFWRKFKLPVIESLLAPATSIEFNPIAPYDFAVTAGARVAIYDSEACKEKRNLSRFKDTVFSGSYRSDGRLIAAGSAGGTVHVVDAATRATLRRFRGHRGPVQVARFASDQVHVLSGGDDCSVRYWDISTERAVGTLEKAHADYIRCAHSTAMDPNVWATGSYDHTVKLWDVRSSLRRSGGAPPAGQSAAAAAIEVDAEGGDDDSDEGGEAGAGSSDEEEGDDTDGSDGEEGADAPHMDDDESGEEEGGDDDDEELEDEANEGAPASSTAARGSESSSLRALASGGGSSSSHRGDGGALLSVDHGEPVTKVMLLPGGSTLLTVGGTSLKLWDILRGGKLMHSVSAHLKMITSLAIDGTGTRLLTGGLDGLVKVYNMAEFAVSHSIRYDAPISSLAVSPDNTRLVVGTLDSKLSIRSRPVTQADRARESKATRSLRGGTYKFFLRGQSSVADADDIRVEVGRKQRLQPYDASLRSFEYGSALDEAAATGNPLVFVGMMEELVARSGLTIALAGREEGALLPILALLVKHIVDPRFCELLVDVTHVILDMYAPDIGQSPEVDTLLQKLQRKVADEAKLQVQLSGLRGQIDMLMAAGAVAK